GMQVWYSPNDDKSKIIADNILNITKSNLQPDNTRLNKKSDSSYYLLYKAQVPSVMVECGFMSNSEENQKLQDSKYQKQLAYSIMLGFSEYLVEEL
ncbi:MAG: N-acetylmuramoyl-L-alanine amidase, partial [Eubacterium sp.]